MESTPSCVSPAAVYYIKGSQMPGGGVEKR
jgi:hypothetical protein